MNHSPSTLEKLRRELLDSVDRYFQALYEGDVSELRQSFHPRARYATVVEGAPLILDLEEYLAVVAKRQSPRERGDDRRYVVSQSQLAGSTAALVALQSCMLGKEFTDYISFLRIDDRWQIIAKVFHADPITLQGE